MKLTVSRFTGKTGWVVVVLAGVLVAGSALAQSGSGTTRSDASVGSHRTEVAGVDYGHATHAGADARFMQGMIPHHAQALDMTALVPDRTTRRDIRLLAERIEVAQADEIAWMQRWLRDRDEAVPGLGAHAGHHAVGDHALMPGMLTPVEMADLARATGPDFDRLFLLSMIRHHEGALVMVRELLASPGAAQASDVYRFASDIDADQRADIQRMRAMQEAPFLPVPDRP